MDQPGPRQKDCYLSQLLNRAQCQIPNRNDPIKTPHQYRAKIVVNTATRQAQNYQKHLQTKPQTKPLGGPARSVT